LGHVHGISFSGGREDAFRSGHALHMGALASAAGTLRTRPRWAIRAFAIGLSLTRVVVLAHWASDVVAGFALGAILVTPSILRRRTLVPILESLKEYAERTTGLRKPGKSRAPDLIRTRKPHAVRFKDDGPIIRDGRLSSIGAPCLARLAGRLGDGLVRSPKDAVGPKEADLAVSRDLERARLLSVLFPGQLTWIAAC